jgi:hypothetical protein
MSQRRLTRQQVAGDADPLLDYAGRQMEGELRAENAARSAGAAVCGGRSSSLRAQQFAEAGLKIATDTAGTLGRSHSHRRKGSLTAVGMRARGSQWEKLPHRGTVQDQPHCGAPGWILRCQESAGQF